MHVADHVTEQAFNTASILQNPFVVIPVQTLPTMVEPPRAVDPLRECLTQCQQVEGKSPAECQERCRGLTPGEVGCQGFVDCFIKGFQIPKGAQPLMIIVLVIVLVIAGLALLTR